MRKSLFILPFAVLALASCSSDEVTSVAQETPLANADQLVIRPVVQGTTRAVSTTTASLTGFDVFIEGDFQKGEENTELWGAQKQTVSKSGSSWVFPAGIEYWWANKSTTAKFTAFAPTGVIGESKPTTQSISVANDIDDQIDYLVAYNEGIRENFDAGVPLNFQHVMSQIIIKALNKDAGTIKVEVAGMKLVNIKNQNTLTFPTASTAAGDFSWTSYTPWAAAATGSDNYTKFTSSESVSATGSTTMTGTAQNLADPMLLLPQTLDPQALDATDAATMNKNYLAILVRVKTTAEVGYRDADGYYYYDASTKIAFTAKRNPADDTNNTYTEGQLKALKAGDVTAAATAGLKALNSTDDITSIYTQPETLYPREGFGTTSEKYAYVGVALDTEWKPGYKYTYTLNFSKDGIGKSIADQPVDKPAADAKTENNTLLNFPYGLDYTTGEAEQPGEDIVDNPTQLFFTVTVDEWIDADPINKDM